MCVSELCSCLHVCGWVVVVRMCHLPCLGFVEVAMSRFWGVLQALKVSLAIDSIVLQILNLGSP